MNGLGIRRGDKKELSAQEARETRGQEDKERIRGNEMVLRLDPEDPEAEEKERARVEAAAVERLAQAQREARQALQGLLYDRRLTTREFQGLLAQHNQDFVAALGEVMRRAEMQEAAGQMEQQGRQAVERTVSGGVEAGVNVAIRQLERVGATVNYGLVNRFAVDWANSYAHDLHDRLNRSTGRQVNDAITAWMASGEHLDSLVASLEPIFGRVRAERIAATETTRAFAEGNLVAYRQSGVVTAVEWKTARDELVCPICLPMHGQRGTLESGQFEHPGGSGKAAQYGGRSFRIPAHVNCRCTVAAIVR